MEIFLIILAFIGMEAVAWLAHKYLMHGMLWFLHRDHHQKDDRSNIEKNDSFFLIFATPGIIFLYSGIEDKVTTLFWIGLGITMYGITYFLIHDLFIHQRIRFFRNTNSRYLRAIRKAHKMHHKHLGRKNGECFGMLWVPFKYFKEEAKSKSS